MELRLQRMHHVNGTNGVLKIDNAILCYTIELPWRENRRGLSCIPEGKYRLDTRYSPRFGNHLIVQQVPGRSLILLHPANNALNDLKGCIAPVSALTSPGKGEDSVIAFRLVRDIVYKAIHAGESVWIIINHFKTKHHEATTNRQAHYCRTLKSTHTKVL